MTHIPDALFYTATVPSVSQIWEQALSFGEKLCYASGTYLFPYNEQNNNFFYLQKGKLTILHDAANGKSRPMLFVHPGNLVNIAHSLGSRLTNVINVGCLFHCHTDVTLWSFPASLLEDENFVRKYPALIINVMNSLGLRLLIMHQYLAKSGTSSLRTKLCSFALNLVQTSGKDSPIQPGISQAKMAELFGVRRGSFLRALHMLREEGVILEMTKESLIIGNMGRLREIALQ